MIDRIDVRDYLAGQFLQGYIAHYGLGTTIKGFVAATAYEYADALLNKSILDNEKEDEEIH